jgi:molybdopterin molybdotransferase
MLSVTEALELVLQHVQPLTSRAVPLFEALGCKLAEDAASDVDSPPHDKSIVDGYAIRFDDLTDGKAELRVIEEVTAGRVPQKPVEQGTATRIMTGAPLPAGADAVVMVENSTLAGDRVTLDSPKAARGRNIVRRGASMRKGDVVLRSGTTLTPAQIGLAAEVGRATLSVVPRPRVAVLATGDELVPADKVPSAGQIRNSNGPLLAALVSRAEGVPVELGIARDVRDDLRTKIAEGLRADVLVLSGGVSAGVLDLVPSVLAELGVQQVFHKVNLKPGKPLWFGTFTASDGTVKPVFGLPGNPVSTLVCFELFVRPATARLRGTEAGDCAVPLKMKLGGEFMHQGDRPTYWPGRTCDSDLVRPLEWKGSGDLRTIAEADCLICFPAGDRRYAAGEMVEVRAL